MASNLPFVEEIIADLRRFKECIEDDQDVNLGRDRFDLLTQLGLLERVQRSPALWVMTQAGENAIAQPATGEPVYQVRNNAFEERWRETDREIYDSVDGLPEYERRVLWAAPPAAAAPVAGEPVAWVMWVNGVAADVTLQKHIAEIWMENSDVQPLGVAAPPAAAHGDDAVLPEAPELLISSGELLEADTLAPASAYRLVNAEDYRELREAYLAMRAQGDGETQ